MFLSSKIVDNDSFFFFFLMSQFVSCYQLEMTFVLPPLLLQLGRIYLDMLNVYKVMSENISSAIATNGESVTKQPLIRSMRTVKKETLKLISGWVSQSTDPQMVSFCLSCCSSYKSTGWERSFSKIFP